MEFTKISPDLTVSPQIAPDDVAAVRAQGFRSIICNRPDGESADQPPFAEVAAAARKAGLEARYIPVRSDAMGEEDAESFRAALRDLPGPVLAYCRSGARSTKLWTLSEAGTPAGRA